MIAKLNLDRVGNTDLLECIPIQQNVSSVFSSRGKDTVANTSSLFSIAKTKKHVFNKAIQPISFSIPSAQKATIVVFVDFVKYIFLSFCCQKSCVRSRDVMKFKKEECQKY